MQKAASPRSTPALYSPHGDVTPNEPPPPYTDEDAEVLLHTFLSSPAPPQTALAPLPLPFCLPQATTAADAPIVRGWNDALAASGVELNDWLGFLDGLNIAVAASPPLRVVDFAGKVIGLVPYHWAMIAGMSMQAGAQAGIRVLQKTLTDRYLRRANALFFAPRGLHVRICRERAVRQIVGLAPEGQGTWGTAARVGQTALKIGLRIPIAKRVINKLAPAPPSISYDTLASTTLASRRLATMGPSTHTLPATLTGLPPPARPESVLDKTTALGMKLDAWRAGRGVKHHIRGAARGAVDGVAARAGAVHAGGYVRGFDQIQERLRGVGERLGRQDQEEVEIANRIEALSNEGALWIMLLDAEHDAVISGTELVDGAADEERVSEADFAHEMALELGQGDEGR